MIRNLIQHLFCKKLLKSKSKLLVRILWYREQNKELREKLANVTHRKDYYKEKTIELRKKLFLDSNIEQEKDNKKH